MIKPRTVYDDEMSTFTESSIYKRVSFVLCIFGLLFEFISFVAPFWITRSFGNGTTINIGLWFKCNNLDCSSIKEVPAWLTSAAVFDLLSIMFGVVCVVSISIFIFKPGILPKRKKWPIIVVTVFAFSEALLQQIASGIFLKNVHDFGGDLFPSNAFSFLSWAVAFSLLGVVLYTVVCILLFTDLIRICFSAPKGGTY